MYGYRCPTRIDLAGGTLDCWPLYLFVPSACTLNVAIDIYTQVALEPHNHEHIIWRQVTDVQSAVAPNTSADTTSAEAVHTDMADANANVDANADVNINADSTSANITELKFKNLDHFLNSKDPHLSLMQAVVSFFRPTRGFVLSTQSQSPIGAGLGASSSLCVALIKVFEQMCDSQYGGFPSERSTLKLIELAHNLEAQALCCPTGTQDYVPAILSGEMFTLSSASSGTVDSTAAESSATDSSVIDVTSVHWGAVNAESFTSRRVSSRTVKRWLQNRSVNLNALHYGVEGLRIEEFSLPSLVFDSMLLVYTGVPHHSGLNNWDAMKLALGEPTNPSFKSLTRIADVAAHMFRCFKKYEYDFKNVAKKDAARAAAFPSSRRLMRELPLLWQQEFEARRGLSPSFVGPRIEELKKLVTPHGVEAIKVCGAGGGGCCVLWAKPSKHQALRDLCTQNGFQPLDFKVENSPVCDS